LSIALGVEAIKAGRSVYFEGDAGGVVDADITNSQPMPRSWPWPAIAGDAVAGAIELISFSAVAIGAVTPRLISLQNLASFSEHYNLRLSLHLLSPLQDLNRSARQRKPPTNPLSSVMNSRRPMKAAT